MIRILKKMGKQGSDLVSRLVRGMVILFISCILRVLSVGPIPTHLALILDGNRRFAKKNALEQGVGYNAGYFALVSLLLYSYKLGIKYMTIYAFSIDNFRRGPEEVKLVMDIIQEKTESFLEKDSLVHRLGIRVCFIGNLKLLSDPVRITAENIMKVTADNTKLVLSICVAYTSTDEILRAIEGSCKAKDKFHEMIQILNKMGKHGKDLVSRLFCGMAMLFDVFVSCILGVLSVGPIPTHLALILDGNRRFAKKNALEQGVGYNAGYVALMSLLLYSYKLGIKYVTIYAFSIDNFRRGPEEVKLVMDLIQEKAQGFLEKESLVQQLGIRVCFIGNLKLLSDSIRITAESIMKATADNSNLVLSICVAYTSTDEILRAIEGSCKAKENLKSGAQIGMEGIDLDEKQEPNGRPTTNGMIKGVLESKNKQQGQHPSYINLVDIEKHMNMAIAPEPDVLIRTSGETRLSNFLLWQTSSCLLYAPNALWPEIGLRHLIWAVLKFQRNHSYLEKKRKMS